MKLSDLKISTRLQGLVALLLALQLTVGAVGLLGLHRVATAGHEFVQEDFAASQALAVALAELLQLRRHEKDLLIGLGDADAMKKAHASWETSRTAADAQLAKMATLAAHLGVAETLNALTQALPGYYDVYTRVSRAAIGGKYESTLAAHKDMGEARAAFHTAEKSIQAMEEALERRAAEGAKAIETT